MKRALIVPSLLLLLAAGGAAAKAKPDAKPSPKADPAKKAKADDSSTSFAGEIVNVNVVNVDVYVTDKKGHRVTDLTKDDFSIFEDGRPVAITNFYSIDGSRPTAPAPLPLPPPSAAPAAPVPPPEPVAAPGTPEDQRLVLIVYIDNFNLRPFDRNRVLRDLRVFLNTKLKRDDLIMLVSYDRSVHIRQPFTSDPSLVNRQLTDMEKISAQGTHADSDRRDALKRIEDSQSPEEALSAAHSYAESQYNDLSFSIDALRDIVNGLAGMPGRKAVIYVSNGLQMIVGQDVYYAVQNKYKDAGGLTDSFDFDTSTRFRELTSTANANRVTFYTLDAGGLRSYESTSAENQLPGQGVFIDQISIQNLQSSIQFMAEQTGGKAVINTNDFLQPLERIAEDFRSYYSLGYSPQHNGDGRYHEIKVKLNRKGLNIRHRAGYRDKTPDAQMNDGTLAALNFPFQSNPLGLDLDFGAAQRRPDGFFLQPVEVKIPLGKLVMIPREQDHEASVRVFVAALDGQGATSEVQQTPVPIRIPNADFTVAVGKFYTYTLTLLMRPGEQKVAVGLHDDVGNASSFIARTVRVGG
ncbi:MAG TPA: VWA domain-containing protein [Thermoanaerobaculia bacterium]|nr:VWA domain-containing protein [Thermoanaerobaculia bacterium]